ncbi:CopG family transcriptional regulator [Stetteria hydrogenophila]
MAGERVEIRISREAYEKAKRLAEEAGFSSVEELVEFLINEAAGSGSEPSFTPEEEEKVKQRLRDLGYI